MAATPDQYAVIGNPVAHSRSPWIHAAFATQTGQALEYGRIAAPLDGFAAAVAAFAARGGRGLNVTVPFKLEAHALAAGLSERARAAGAVNTMSLRDGRIEGDNTDGVGLVRDIERNLGFAFEGRRVLLLGAGGAARGVILPILEKRPARLVIANRTADKARALADTFSAQACSAALGSCGFDGLRGGYDLIVNATAGSLQGESLPLPASAHAGCALAYDMMYGAQPSAWMRAALAQGAARAADGLGMLVEQAAESFFVWRGVAPDTAPVLAALRTQLAGEGK